QLLADRRRRQAKPPPGRREAAGVGDEDEGTHGTERASRDFFLHGTSVVKETRLLNGWPCRTPRSCQPTSLHRRRPQRRSNRRPPSPSPSWDALTRSSQ